MRWKILLIKRRRGSYLQTAYIYVPVYCLYYEIAGDVTLLTYHYVLTKQIAGKIVTYNDENLLYEKVLFHSPDGLFQC